MRQKKIMGSREGWVGGGLGEMGKDREGTHSGCQDFSIILGLNVKWQVMSVNFVMPHKSYVLHVCIKISIIKMRRLW